MDTTPVLLKDTTANPAPLGLMGFGMTTVLLNLHNAGLIAMSSMILAMGLCYGGIAQVIAGIMEWKKQNSFGTLAFTSYGLFWISLVVLLVMPKLGLAAPTDKASLASYLLLWGIFTFFMFIGTLRANTAIIIVFGSLTILFGLLAAGDFTGNETITRVAGWEGLFVGASAMYLGIAQILNESYGRVVLPIGVRK